MKDNDFHALEKIMGELDQMQRENGPLISDVLSTLDWDDHLDTGTKPWVTCRDEKGNLYTIYPVYNEEQVVQEGWFEVYRHPKK